MTALDKSGKAIAQAHKILIDGELYERKDFAKMIRFYNEHKDKR